MERKKNLYQCTFCGFSFIANKRRIDHEKMHAESEKGVSEKLGRIGIKTHRKK